MNKSKAKKLNELPYDGEFLNALGELEMRILEDYRKFKFRGKMGPTHIRQKMYAKFAANLGYIPGSKYLKIVKDNSVWGYINLENKNFKEGDILKAASWNTPALNKARGNIFRDNYEISWTGPKYLPGSTGRPTYEMRPGTA